MLTWNCNFEFSNSVILRLDMSICLYIIAIIALAHYFVKYFQDLFITCKGLNLNPKVCSEKQTLSENINVFNNLFKRDILLENEDVLDFEILYPIFSEGIPLWIIIGLLLIPIYLLIDSTILKRQFTQEECRSISQEMRPMMPEGRERDLFYAKLCFQVATNRMTGRNFIYSSVCFGNGRLTGAEEYRYWRSIQQAKYFQDPAADHIDVERRRVQYISTGKSVITTPDIIVLISRYDVSRRVV